MEHDAKEDLSSGPISR